MPTELPCRRRPSKPSMLIAGWDKGPQRGTGRGVSAWMWSTVVKRWRPRWPTPPEPCRRLVRRRVGHSTWSEKERRRRAAAELRASFAVTPCSSPPKPKI